MDNDSGIKSKTSTWAATRTEYSDGNIEIRPTFDALSIDGVLRVAGAAVMAGVGYFVGDHVVGPLFGDNAAYMGQVLGALSGIYGFVNSGVRIDPHTLGLGEYIISPLHFSPKEKNKPLEQIADETDIPNVEDGQKTEVSTPKERIHYKPFR